MTHTRRPILLSCVLALTLATATVLAQQPPGPATQPTPQRPTEGAADQGRIQMPRRAGGLGPARDRATTPEVGTARIRGRVVDDSGQALRRVTVRTFSTQGGQGFGGRQPRMATTDADGRYELSELPAGTYQVMAMKGAFVQQSYGQRSRNGPGRPIELADGQSVDKIDFVLARGGVIVGRVVDELGEPMAEVSVQAMRFVPVSGSSRLVPMGRNATSDDLGQFRLYGLAPGEYIVSAHMRNMMFGPETPPAGDNSGYAPTYSPGTTSVAEATRVQVQSGQEVNADVQLTAARMLRVSGVILTSLGKAPENGFLRLVPKGDVVMGGMMGLNAPILNGTFSFNQVSPGSYTLTVRVGGEFGPGRSRSGSEGQDDSEFAMVPITVAGEDLANVRVVTGKGLTISGVVIAEGGPLPTDQPLRVMITPGEPDGMMMTARPSTVEAGGRFQIEGVIGEGRVNLMGLGRGWMLKAVDYKGANVTDKPVEFASDGGPLRIVVTNRVPILSGTVTSGNGAPLTDYEVLIFTTDTTVWERPGRQVRVARADQQGGFKVEGLPAGDYYVAAFSSLEDDSRTSPEVLARARSVAQQVTLVEGQTRSVSLKLSTLPQQ
jgi:hypothetical protein